MTGHDHDNWFCRRFAAFVLVVFFFAPAARAQQPQPSQPEAAQAPSTSTPSDAGKNDDNSATPTNTSSDLGTEPVVDSKNRIFGVMPNYTTVEGVAGVKPITGAESFKMAFLDSFDPFVYPLFGFVAGVNHLENAQPQWGQGWSGYFKRYGLAFADNTSCSLITTGLMPTLLKQDPRYYQGRKSGFIPRFAYAASRSAVTKSRSGHPQFNMSEIGGTLVVANLSNFYYPADERTTRDTLERWGTQAMWDTVANELKEFWPDIRRMLHHL